MGAKLLGVLRGVVKLLGSFLSRPVRLIHLVKCDSKHHQVKEHQFSEVVDTLVERQIRWNFAYFSQTFLLNDDPVESDFEPVAELAKVFKEEVPHTLLLGPMTGFELPNQSVVDGAERVSHES